jgi:hypothetical protein
LLRTSLLDNQFPSEREVLSCSTSLRNDSNHEKHMWRMEEIKWI